MARYVDAAAALVLALAATTCGCCARAPGRDGGDTAAAAQSLSPASDPDRAGKSAADPVLTAVAPGGDLVPQDDADARLLAIARKRLEERDAVDAAKGRRTSITRAGGRAVVTYHLPDGWRGGDFIITIDEEKGEVVDSKFWR